MDKYIYDESNGLWYELQEDYYIPCLVLLPSFSGRYRPFQSGYACTGKMVIVGRIGQARRSKATRQDKIDFPRVEIR